ncbi:MAG: PLP-dependent transferase, partial [Bacteroidales bacterium]
GVLCGNDTALMKAAVEYRKFVGHMISPDDAYRLHTQVQTLMLRFSQQCSNASRLAELFNNETSIGRVWYPGLEQHPTHKEALKLFGGRGFGGMITIDFKGSGEEKKERRDKFIKGVAEKIKIVPSLGDPRTMILPVESVWGAKYPEPGMLRLSVGFEEYHELEDTLIKALRRDGVTA